ncbi:hypothetical protein YK48G_21500 [Lentilactobacillus fungorum]|uniref:Uncharacterized protein n=1 Tax=Lentilactobacillus fungorum TaxID=2201250 RepID=A0ABQ3W0M6_9LACO|nr:hypothetical protein YK48G_21500 [Lentilactobacillus fungorum]
MKLVPATFFGRLGNQKLTGHQLGHPFKQLITGISVFIKIKLADHFLDNWCTIGAKYKEDFCHVSLLKVAARRYL